MTMPIRMRLTLVFALGMAIVLAAFGAFVYFRVGRDILASVDLGLRVRGQTMAAQVAERGSGAIVSAGGLIDPDESFAQVLDDTGWLLRASSATLKLPSSPLTRFGPSQGPVSS